MKGSVTAPARQQHLAELELEIGSPEDCMCSQPAFSMWSCFSYEHHSWARESKVVGTLRNPLENFAFCSHKLCCTGSEISVSERQILAPRDNSAIALNCKLRQSLGHSGLLVLLNQ